MKITLILLLFLPVQVRSQKIDQGLLDVLTLKEGGLPQNILSTRSVVLISVPEGTQHGMWKKWATEMQEFFGEVGIDAIAYLLVDDLAENVVAQKELTKNVLAKRGVSNLITLSVLDEENRFLMTIGPYNRKWTFFDKGAAFWMRETSDLENIWSELGTLFRTDSYRRKNLLVLETPEFFDLSIPFTSRTERFTKLMESQKVAVPMYVSLEDDPNLILRFKSDILNGTEDRGTAQTALMNEALKSTIETYPFEAELVNLNEKSEDQWIRSGYGFILYQATGTEPDLRAKLKYKPVKSTTKGNITKFYLKQLRTGNLYFGREWDAAAGRTQALENFIGRVRTEFKSDN